MGMIINVKKSYFNYLSSLVADQNHDPKRYSKLLALLYETPYQVLNPMDANRVLDGEALREKWLDHARVKDERLRVEYVKDLGTDAPSMLGASMLEVLIGLAVHINDYILADPDKPELVANLFWNFIDNIVDYGSFGSKYHAASDILYDEVWCDYTRDTMNTCLDRINKRTYHTDGTGGLFPLRKETINQRKEELWTCAIAYINENYT